MSQQQQPVQGFPNDMPIQPKNTPITQSSSHSNGSFGTVFIILTVVLVISVLACLIGRICNKKRHGNHSPKQREVKQSHDIHPREGDIEFGIDKRIPTSKVAGSNGDLIPTSTMPYNNGHEGKGGVRFAEDHM
ncbi:PREDICTED: uncharacterized protein LOC109238273 [Nicotiana attenuata]|uniref:Uncharacterized protein n=1 Tax=Nicotiana attenuata TaxID=49451 RepID=A0A314LCC0_NICAT|nr:PREDICTED: uncharacterized protein LOC109238273 [Nicotiana attenuata]OIT39295.1 hypothetical protein A4A49_03492 [Nicotiana attenuata]